MPDSADACDPDRLTALVRSGDPEALDRITRCYGERLLAAGRRHCRSAEEAHDAVQDAWLTAATHLHEFRGEGSLAGWLVSIVASACSRLRRGRKNDASLHEAATDAPIVSAEDSPELSAARRELGAAVDAALLELAPEDRLILLLAEVEELTGPEIAARTGLSPGAVRVRLTRIRARVRDALAPFLDDRAVL